MNCRKEHNRQEIAEHYRTIHHGWTSLCRRMPAIVTMVSASALTVGTHRKGNELGYVTDQRRHIALQQGITTFNWALGDRITKELLAVGQNPMLTSLMGIRQAFTYTEVTSETVDIQTVLLLTVLRGISQVQYFEDRSLFIIKLLDELELDNEFYNKLVETAISVELVYTREAELDVLFNNTFSGSKNLSASDLWI